MRLLHLSNVLSPAVSGGTKLFVQQLLPNVPILLAAQFALSVDADHDGRASLASHQRLGALLLLSPRFCRAAGRVPPDPMSALSMIRCLFKNSI